MSDSPRVLVAGGGTAGLAAAVAAARSGATVTLVERHGLLGGMGSVALVHTLCGLYELADDTPPRWANPGLPAEFATRLLARGDALPPVRLGRVHVLPHRPAGLAQAAADWLAETPRVTVRLLANLRAADSATGRVEISTPTGRETLAADAWIDATGDAALARLAGAPTEHAPPDRLQRPAYIVTLSGVDPAALAPDARLRLAAQIARAVSAGHLPPGAVGAALRAFEPGGDTFVTIDLAGPPDYDPTDPATLAALLAEGRQLAEALTAYLRRESPGFASAVISAHARQLGVRESHRVIGRARLEADDLLRGTTFPDAVARATWPMELRENHRGPRLRFPESNRPADIPAGCLQARDLPRLFAAGRCVSCSHEAQASIRVMGTCLATGEAAGRLAAASSR